MTTDMVERIMPTVRRRLPTAAEIMSRNPPTIGSQASLFSAWGHLHGGHHRHLVVIDDDVRPIGVLDDRDIAMEWPPGPVAAHHVPAHELLRVRARPRVRASDDVATVAEIMLGSRDDALPVVDDDGRLIGLVTVWHCLELLADARACDRQGHLTIEPAPAGSHVGS
jgi:CBS domain-containing protein